ncbi:hypothetical protein XAPC_394 [Xanthomonas citri pv. punicae str. LMG 859]|nr:hypothetical protein XAPC_394 [Xanthomonas citri pv. punicae str. LMG 859]
MGMVIKCILAWCVYLITEVAEVPGAMLGGGCMRAHVCGSIHPPCERCRTRKCIMHACTASLLPPGHRPLHWGAGCPKGHIAH